MPMELHVVALTQSHVVSVRIFRGGPVLLQAKDDVARPLHALLNQFAHRLPSGQPESWPDETFDPT